eukprot:528160_1
MRCSVTNLYMIYTFTYLYVDDHDPRGPGFTNAFVMDPWLASRLRDIINDWNGGSRRDYVDYHLVKTLFINFGINYAYFKKKQKQQFRDLLKNKLNIKQGPATKIWHGIKEYGEPLVVQTDWEDSDTY